MFTIRIIRRHATSTHLLVLLALFALGGTACSDLESVLPIGEEPGAGEGASEEPTADQGDAGEPAAEPADGDDDAAADAPAAGEAGAEQDAGAGAVEPITAEDIARICGDEEARTATAEELAPLVGATPQAFEDLVCESVAS